MLSAIRESIGDGSLAIRRLDADSRNPKAGCVGCHIRASTYLADFIQLALHTGCRRSELLKLEWKRVDLRRNVLVLDGVHTKSGKPRCVPINAAARLALLRRAAFRRRHCPKTAWVFCNRKGARIQDVKRSFHTACTERLAIMDFRVHDLRHTCAAWLVTAGVALPVVRDLLGHSTIKMTERCAHLAPETVRAALDILASSRFRHVDGEQSARTALSA